jgi:hypothetical protein
VLALRPTPNLEDQSPEFMSPWGRVARLYPRALAGSGTSGAPLPVPTMWTPEGRRFITVIKKPAVGPLLDPERIEFSSRRQSLFL